MNTILVVDSEASTFDLFQKHFTGQGFSVHHAATGKEGLKKCLDLSNPLIITEMNLDDMNGLEFIKQAQHLVQDINIVVVTMFGSIENAVEALQLGAIHYLVKPLSTKKIKEITAKIKHTPKKVKTTLDQGLNIVAESQIMREILDNVQRIAQNNANVFITGESGTGKEVIAHTLHYQSLRAKQSYVRINCAAVPETLIESEFFGHEKGSFTGASTLRMGRFELAHEGSLLLDEVTEIPLALQAKLLRVVQEREFERVGGTKSIKVDVRIISTSNRDIVSVLQDKHLREDLYYRLNVVPIHIPPLRERIDDILPLSEHFLKKICQENQIEQKQLTKKAREKLLEYHWPGNVRELANAMERAIVMHPSKEITPDHLMIDSHCMPPKVTLEDIEKNHILEMLQEEKFNRSKTAKALGITVRKLNSKIDEFKIETPE